MGRLKGKKYNKYKQYSRLTAISSNLITTDSRDLFVTTPSWTAGEFKSFWQEPTFNGYTGGVTLPVVVLVLKQQQETFLLKSNYRTRFTRMWNTFYFFFYNPPGLTVVFITLFFWRCPCLWLVCDGTDNWHSPAVHWTTHPLLARRVQTQPDPHQHVQLWRGFYSRGHLLWTRCWTHHCWKVKLLHCLSIMRHCGSCYNKILHKNKCKKKN